MTTQDDAISMAIGILGETGQGSSPNACDCGCTCINTCGCTCNNT